MKKNISLLLRKFQPACLLAVLFIGYIFYVGSAGISELYHNTMDTLRGPLDPGSYIQTINNQYSSMLNTDPGHSLLQDKGTYINLNGLMARLLGQLEMNERVTLKNGHLSRVDATAPVPEEIQQAAENIIRFYHAHKENNGDFLFVMVSSQISKYEDLLPAGYTDTTHETADTFLFLLEQAGVPYLDLREEMQQDGMSVTDAYFTTDHHWKPQTGLWAYGKILTKLAQMEAIEPVDSFYIDPSNYSFEVYKNTFLGSSGKRTGKYYAGVDDSILLQPNFETDISICIPDLELELQGPYEDVAYSNDGVPDYENPDFFNDSYYSLYGWADRSIMHWRNGNAPVQEKFLLIGESFGNIPFSLMSLCFSSCDELDMRTFDVADFTRHYETYKPDNVVLLFNIRNVLSEFTETSYLD